MSDRISKEIKSDVRGVLLSKVGGVPVKNFLTEYQAVISESLDFHKLGFKSLLDFLEAIPDVAKVVKTSDGMSRVLGVALNEFNITARKNCYKGPSNGGENRSKSSNFRKSNKQSKISLPVITDKASASDRDFRATLLENFNVITSDGRNDPNIKETVVFVDPIIKKQSSENNKPENAIVLKQTGDVSQSKQVNSKATNSKDSLSIKFERLDKFRAQLLQSSLYGTIPKSMVLSTLQQMFNDTCPGKQLPQRSNFPSTVDILLTHVDPQDKNYFWGIIVSPYNAIIDSVFNLDGFKNEFKMYSGGKRAVVKCYGYYARAWVTSIEDNMASVFMIDYGNTEEVSLSKLELAPTHLWNCPPIVVPFKHEKEKDFNLKKHINERFRCTLKDKSDHIFAVESMIRV